MPKNLNHENITLMTVHYRYLTKALIDSREFYLYYILLLKSDFQLKTSLY